MLVEFSIYTVLLFFLVLQCHGSVYIHSGSNGAVIINGKVYGNDNPGRPTIHASSYKTWENGICQHIVSIVGRGVKEHVEEPCSPWNSNSGSTISTPNCVVVGDPYRDHLCYFTDKWGTLVEIKNGECTLKTYTTVGKETTSTPTPMTPEVCEAVKTKMAEELSNNDKYWDKWNRRFNRRMRNAFPPGFPFHKPQPPERDSESEEHSPPGPYISPYSAIPTNVNAGAFGITSSATTSPSSQALPTVPLSPSPSPDTTTVPMSPQSTDPSTSATTPLSTSTSDATPHTNVPSTPPSTPVDTTSESGNNEITDTSVINSPVFRYVVNFPEDNKSDKCKVEILIRGRGVKYSFLEPCSEDVVYPINREDVFVFGHPKKNPFCLFSEKWGTLVTIRNKICTIITYTIDNNGEPIPNKDKVPLSKCSAIKRRMIELLEGNVESSPQTPSQLEEQPPLAYATQTPHAVPDTFIENHKKNFDGHTINNFGTGKVTHGAGSIINGVYTGNGFNSDRSPLDSSTFVNLAPDSLITQPLSSSSSPYQSSGNKIINNVGNFGIPDGHYNYGDAVIKNFGVTDSFNNHGNGQVIYGDVGFSTRNSYSSGGSMRVNTNRFSNNGNCRLEYQVERRGIYDVFQLPCDSSISSNTYNFEDSWIFGKVDRDDFLLYSDTYANMVVFSGGKCVRKTYNTGDGNPTSTELTEDECTSYKDKMRKAVEAWTEAHEIKMAEKERIRQERLEEKARKKEIRAQERALRNQARQARMKTPSYWYD